MPRRAIADSDDEEDDLSTDINARDVPILLPEDRACVEAAIDNIDGTNDKSTGSTELLRRQIQSAERGLVSNSAPGTMEGLAAVSYSSPSMQATKRRHTSVLGPASNSSVEKSVKRTKTLKTYGAGGRGREANFNHSQEDEAAFKTSPSETFTEHSGAHSSVALPSGFVQEDFMNHEPSVMFANSGSTIVDNSSAQRRLLESALESRRFLTPSEGLGLKSDEENSSIPWSTAEGNNSTKATRGTDAQRVETTGMDAVEAGATTEVTVHARSTNAPPEAASLSNRENEDVLDHAQPEPGQADVACDIQPSPLVEIPCGEAHVSSPTRKTSSGTQKAQRGQKRKIQQPDIAESLVSDDRPVGLPEEQYKPRPSRRRATQIPEEPVDFSMRPERAAKVKRTKTANNADTRSATIDTNPSDSGWNTINVDGCVNVATKERSRESESVAAAPLIEALSTQKSTEEIVDAIDVERELLSQTATQGDTLPQSRVERKTEDTIFVKPPRSTQTKKASAKSKRSHTTIFEDHMEFSGSQRTPSLSQQQANRQSTLQAVQNDATTSKRKRKTVVSDDEDENEDEQGKPEAGEPSQATKENRQEELAPKKRGRGRPSKSAAKSVSEHANNPLLNSKDVEGDPAALQEDFGMVERGRLPKAINTTEPMAKAGNQGEEVSNGKLPNTASREHSSDIVEVLRSDPPSGTSKSTELPTPSPEKQTTPPKLTAAGPTAHSPIKKSAGPQFRVGLSKSHRIPSLLRTMNPKKAL